MLILTIEKTCVIMHPLPRRHEIEVSVDEDPRAVFWRQERNGMWAWAARGRPVSFPVCISAADETGYWCARMRIARPVGASHRRIRGHNTQSWTFKADQKSLTSFFKRVSQGPEQACTR
ncbi:MAG: hypothetical protein Q8O90_06255 [Elusimicrobiota bacterium]|nr:hypothetical protein [Elusimicrobiota bacterium]